jgi:SAM-dependent methyltransferase
VSDQDRIREAVEANRRVWDQWAHVNAASAFYDVERFREGGIRLRPYELEEMGEVAGKDLLHLQCHFGLDTLSFARLGARPTGVDFSAEAIALARSLTLDLGLDATFVLSDLGDLPNVLPGDFDVVYASRGVLAWLPELDEWARVAAHFLRPGGFLYVTESHPVLWVWDDDEGVTDLRLRYPYFSRRDPIAFPVKGSYADREADVTEPLEYGWTHDLGSIVTAVADAGLRVDFLHEFPFVEWPVPFLEERDGRWWLPASAGGELPLFFSLKASKP